MAAHDVEVGEVVVAPGGAAGRPGDGGAADLGGDHLPRPRGVLLHHRSEHRATPGPPSNIFRSKYCQLKYFQLTWW